MKVLIVGLGSIAKKHIKVLTELVKTVEFYALRSNKNASVYEEVINIYDWNVIRNIDFHFVLVTSPSALHLTHLRELSELNIPMMVEKPFLINLNQIKEFEKLRFNNQLIYAACNLRFHPVIVFIKEYLTHNPSKVNEVNAYCGSYLPAWRPDQDYREIYSSKNELGGGVHLDLIHEPDYLIYLFGEPMSVEISNRKVSNLEIDTVDSSHYLFQYNNFQAEITLNYFRKDTKRTLEIVREKDTLLVNFMENSVVDLVNNIELFKEEIPSIYITYKKQMEYFLSCIENNTLPMNSPKEAIVILKCVL